MDAYPKWQLNSIGFFLCRIFMFLDMHKIMIVTYYHKARCAGKEKKTLRRIGTIDTHTHVRR